MNDGTYMALLTPPGKGAIATLAVCGPRAWEIVRSLFQFLPSANSASSSRRLPDDPSAGRFWLGRLGEPGKGGSDEVVLAVRQGQPVPGLEVHGHGGDQAIGLVQDVLAGHGVVACSWQELESRTGAAPLQCLARALLAEAPTLRTACILLDQYHGAFEDALRDVLSRLHAGDAGAGAESLRPLASRARLGRHLVEPWKVVVAGPPNVGKSSLVNALAGYTRCLVSAQPGTTRDVVTTNLAIDGWPVELADTAGWRYAEQPLEREGIDRARQMARDADLCLWLLDGSAAPVLPEEPGINFAFVINKIDLHSAWNWDDIPVVGRVSARTGAGVKELCAHLSRTLAPEAPADGAAVPFSAGLCEQIEMADEACRAGRIHQALALLQQLPGVADLGKALPKL